MTATLTRYPATAKQTAFLRDLAANRAWADDHDYSDVLTAAAAGRDLDGLDKATASALISDLLNTPRRTSTPTAQTRAAEPGYYMRDGRVYVVVWNRERTGTYAKRMVISGGRGSWKYAAGVGRDIAAEGLAPLTVEAAAALGHLHGLCVVCGRALSDPKSVTAGIGPVCAKRVAESHAALTAPAAPTGALGVDLEADARAEEDAAAAEAQADAALAGARPNRYARIASLDVLDEVYALDLSPETVWADGENTRAQADAYVAACQRDYTARRAQIING